MGCGASKQSAVSNPTPAQNASEAPANANKSDPAAERQQHAVEVKPVAAPSDPTANETKTTQSDSISPVDKGKAKLDGGGDKAKQNDAEAKSSPQPGEVELVYSSNISTTLVSSKNVQNPPTSIPFKINSPITANTFETEHSELTFDFGLPTTISSIKIKLSSSYLKISLFRDTSPPSDNSTLISEIKETESGEWFTNTNHIVSRFYTVRIHNASSIELHSLEFNGTKLPAPPPKLSWTKSDNKVQVSFESKSKMDSILIITELTNGKAKGFKFESEKGTATFADTNIGKIWGLCVRDKQAGLASILELSESTKVSSSTSNSTTATFTFNKISTKLAKDVFDCSLSSQIAKLHIPVIAELESLTLSTSNHDDGPWNSVVFKVSEMEKVGDSNVVRLLPDSTGNVRKMEFVKPDRFVKITTQPEKLLDLGQVELFGTKIPAPKPRNVSVNGEAVTWDYPYEFESFVVVSKVEEMYKIEEVDKKEVAVKSGVEVYIAAKRKGEVGVFKSLIQ